MRNNKRGADKEQKWTIRGRGMARENARGTRQLKNKPRALRPTRRPDCRGSARTKALPGTNAKRPREQKNDGKEGNAESTRGRVDSNTLDTTEAPKSVGTVKIDNDRRANGAHRHHREDTLNGVKKARAQQDERRESSNEAKRGR